jgi:serine/threonine-protein kinase HipA
MGALEYHPAVALRGEHNYAGALDVAHLADLANRVTSNRASLRDRLERAVSREQAQRFIRVGSSAGGARSKALVATAADGTLKDGTVDHGIDHQYWLLKFDGAHNSDRDNADPVGMPRVEYIYSIIARDCGIQIPSTAFIELDGSFHFLIERFDRITRNDKLDKLHYVSWSGIAHADRDTTGAFSYEQLALTIKQLNLGQTALTELFRRAVFNIVGRNQDDHTKNFGFLMDRQGHWSLAPAFDMTYSFDPTGLWTQVHQIRLAGKQDHFALDDLLAFAQLCNLKKRAAIDIVKRTASAFQRFDALAKEYQVPNALRETIGRNLRLTL